MVYLVAYLVGLQTVWTFRYYIQRDAQEKDIVLHDKLDFALRRHVAFIHSGLLPALGQQRKGKST